METTHRHQKIPELRRRDIQRHRLPVRPSEQPGWVRQAELHKAERKAQRDELKKFEAAVTILGLSLLSELAKGLTGHTPTPTSKPIPIPTPTQSEEHIIDVEFVDVVEDGDTKALVLTS